MTYSIEQKSERDRIAVLLLRKSVRERGGQGVSLRMKTGSLRVMASSPRQLLKQLPAGEDGLLSRTAAPGSSDRSKEKA